MPKGPALHGLEPLAEMMGQPREDMFKNRDELVKEAYMLREVKIAYVDEERIERA